MKKSQIGFLGWTGLALCCQAVYGQSSCIGVSGSTPMMRSEGQAELTGNLLLNCSGIAIGQMVNLDVEINNGSVPVSDRSGEGLLTIRQSGIATVYPGTIILQNDTGALNLMRFMGISITDPAPALTISGIRANVTSTYLPFTEYGQALESVSVSSGVLPIAQPDAGFLVGIVARGLNMLTLFSAPNVDPCQSVISLDPGSAFTFSIQTNFPSAFKSQGFAGNPPGSSDSESGSDIAEPIADSATQFAIVLGGSLPSQFSFYFPATITSDTGGIAQLVLTEGGSGLASPSGNAVAATPGTTYFYNVVSSDTTKHQTFWFSLTTDPVNPVTFSGGDFAPTLTLNFAPFAADLPVNVPRFPIFYRP